MSQILLIRWIAVLVISTGLFTEIRAEDPPTISRLIEGIDSAPKTMPPGEIAEELNDPWATFVLRQGRLPADLENILSTLNQPGSGGFSVQRSFFVSESGHIPVSPDSSGLKREFRMVITRGLPNSSLPDILISAPAGDRSGFIELMSWDANKKAFNFYRRTSDHNWTWRGDSRDAFFNGSRNNGCFACHVFGVPIMKELRSPWNNWHSQSASIPPEAIPSEAIRQGPLFRQKKGAELLERTVAGWINLASKAQVENLSSQSISAKATVLLRPLFETTTANLTSSSEVSSGSSPDLELPSEFFLDFEVLSKVLNLNTGQFNTKIKRDFYRNAIQKFQFHLQADSFSRPGDTNFAFFVPERALEEAALIRHLIQQGIISEHFVISVLMVDFPNPVYSEKRARLLKYVPSETINPATSNLSARIAQAILAAAATSPDDSPEKQFAQNWRLSPDQLRIQSEERLRKYLAAVEARLATSIAVEDYTRLAESRRRKFAPSALGVEAQLLFPKVNLTEGSLFMMPDGTVSP